MNSLISLNEIVEINPRIPQKMIADPDQKVSFVPMASVSEEGSISTNDERPLKDVMKSYTYFQEGDVLLAKITPCFENGKAALVSGLPNNIGFGSTEFHVLRPGKDVNAKYLFYQIWNPVFRFVGIKNMTGTAGQKRVPVDFLRRYKILLPPLPEQKRIAAILDKADAIRRKRRQAIQLADEFLRSVFLDMFGDPVLNPKGWRRCRFEDVLENIDSGWSPKCLGRAANSVEWGVLKLGAVTSCQYIEHENKALPSTLKPQMESEIKKGDLLFTRKNTYELIAACAYVYETRPKLMISDTIFRFKLRKNAEIVPEYLWALLTHYGKRRQLQSLASGSAGSMPNISKARLSQQKIELPPFEMQNKFAKIFHKIRVASKKQLAHVEKSGELFNSLTQHAFVGKLKQKTDFRL